MSRVIIFMINTDSGILTGKCILVCFKANQLYQTFKVTYENCDHAKYWWYSH